MTTTDNGGDRPRACRRGLRLVTLSLDMQEAYRDMAKEQDHPPNIRHKRDDETWPAYVRRLQCRGFRNRLRHMKRTLAARWQERRLWKHLAELIAYGEHPPDHLAKPRATYVRRRVFWLIDETGRILGSSEVRERDTPFLIYEGGHIGYDIRPSERRKGYGTLILALTLQKAREMGFKRVMLSCEPDYLPSVQVIVKNGGKLENTVISHRGTPKARHWIDL